MKKLQLLIIIILLSFLFSCSGKSLMQEIPMAAFDKFEYHRAGNVSSLHITATGAIMDKDYVVIDNVNIIADYGPFVNFNIILEGYSRERVPDIEDIQIE